jgi:hypothetical protein
MPRHEFLGRLGLPTTFPTFFPPQLEQYRRSISEATDTPDEFAIAFMLAAAGTASGGNVSACVQPSWCVRANVFVTIIGFKGSGKSILSDKVLAPLARHEEELKQRVAFMAEQHSYADHDDEDSDDDGDGDGGGGRGGAKPETPCVIANDCTGPAVLRLLEHNTRQLLFNPDEQSTLFIRNTGGTDRQMMCELYDGRSRRRERASSRSQSVTLVAPYVCLLGGIQPSLFQCTYSQRGDDGLLDRFLLVGDGVARLATWPRDADDPALNAAWAEAVDRLFHIEELAADSLGDQVEARFSPTALEVCRRLEDQLNQLVVLIGVPESQYGVVAKLRQHAVKLALLHRCFRWAAGEFGEQGPFGDIDADDAQAAAAATLFFFGRWLIWRPELRGGSAVPEGAPVGLVSDAGGDPALQALAAMANGAQSGIRLIEQLVRYVRYRGNALVAVDELAAREPLAHHSREELWEACQWLVQQEQGEWVDEQAGTFRLFDISKPRGRRQRGRAALPAGSA